jgi:hypothetical protein
VVLFLSASAQQAYAIWGWIEKLSGPGPFVGVDLVFPYPLTNPPELTSVSMHNDNLHELAVLGVETVRLREQCGEFLDDTRVPGGLIDTFLNRSGQKALLPGRGDRVKAQLELTNKRVLEIVNERLRERFRRFRELGVFCGFRPIVIEDERGRNKVKNLFFTLSLGLALTYENQLRYPDGFTGDKDVFWISVFPALEYRHPVGRDFSLFSQVGPAAHYFAGGAFDDFLVGSARARAGFQYRKVYFGAQGDWFFNSVKPERFGALANEGRHRSTWGLFIGIDLTGRGRRPKPSVPNPRVPKP